MRKIYATQKSIAELEILLANIDKEHDIFKKSKGRIYVYCGRPGAYYRINISSPGQIIVERCMSFLDWFIILSFVVSYSVVAWVLSLTGDIKGTIIGMIIIVGLTIAIFYPLYVILPQAKLKRVLKNWQ